MKFYYTDPPESDWYSVYKEYCHHVITPVLYVDMGRTSMKTDLMDYYMWAVDNKIDITHSCVRTPNEFDVGTVLFMFNDATHAMAFKLRWSE